MQLRALNTALEASLLNNDSFVYYHLVKFERPKPTLSDGSILGDALDYSYITDAPYNVDWDDGSVDALGYSNGSQTYIANKLDSVGGIQETIEARATTMSLKLSLTALGTIVTDNITLSTGDNSISGNLNFALVGFREGDKLLIDGGSNPDKYIIIKRFEYAAGSEIPNTKMYFTQVEGNYTNEPTPTTYTISLVSEELNTLTFAKGSTLYSNYINREVFIYRAHANPETGTIIGEPFLLFKGIISQGAIDEDAAQNSFITWGLTSHWGDFVRVQGRITSDSFHRALDLTGKTDQDALLKLEYESDFGFMHAERSVNMIATYQAQERRYRTSSKLGGLISKTKEYYVTVDRDVDLRFNLESKFIPVVYGVRRIQSIPVFADLPSDVIWRELLFTADVLCEGEIGAIYDIYIEDEPSVCSSKGDSEVRGKTYGFQTEAANVVCIGRADRGDVLYSLPYLDPFSSGVAWGPTEASGLIPPTQGGGVSGIAGIPIPGIFSLANIKYNADKGIDIFSYFTDTDVEGQDEGITHEEFYNFYKPISLYTVFHAGKTDQQADALLSAKASETQDGGYNIQQNYFEGNTTDYWSPAHRLADTAYVASVYTLAEGEETIPEIEYVVKGKYIKCYNYDNSYKHNARRSSEDPNNFSLGQSVSIQVNTGTITSPVWTTRHTNKQIIDKWRMFAQEGVDDYRFICRTDYPNTGDTEIDLSGGATEFRLNNGSGNFWYCHTDDHVLDSGDIVPISKVPITSSSYTGGSNLTLYINFDHTSGNGITAHNILTALSADALLSVGISQTRDPKRMYAVRAYNGSGQITITSSQGAAYQISQDLGTGPQESFFFTNIVKVQDSTNIRPSNPTAGIYDLIFITRLINGIPQTQKKEVIAKAGSTNAILLRGTASYSFIPGLDADNAYSDIGTADTYVAQPSIDERVSINPALQLLDYMSNTRYGKGLSTDKLNLTSFLETARLCDDKSKIKVASSASPSVGDVYSQSAGSVLRFQGTVSNVINRGSLNEIEFDNIIGKLGYKWNDWRTYLNGDLVWGLTDSNGTKVKQASGGIISTKTAFSALPDATVTLSKVSGSGPASFTVNTSNLGGVSNTNPIVRAWTIDTEWSNPGYSLHDSDDVKYWKYLGWDEPEQRYVTRHQMNQLIDTSVPLFDNINGMLFQFNGMLRYSNGLYELDIKTGVPNATDPYWVDGVTRISEEDIIGKIKLDDKGQKDSFNRITSSIIDPGTKFSSRTVAFFNSNYLKEDKGVPKEGTFNLPGITNYYSARTNIIQYLDESRYGLTISFTMDQKGYLLLAGTVISINYVRFGWVDKLFRIESLNIRPNGLVAVVATEHNDEAYLIDYTDRAKGDQPDNEGTLPPILERPTNLTATQDLEGEIRLDWTNSDAYDPAKFFIEIWAVEAERKTDGNYETNTAGDEYIVNDWNLATLLTSTQGTSWVHDGFDSFPHHVWFYWIRYVKPAFKAGETAKYSEFFPYKTEDGVVGQAGAAVSENYTFVWTNQVVVLYRDSNGVVGDLSPTAFEFAVYKGKEKLAAVPPSTPPGVGQWSLTLTGNANVTPDADPYSPGPVSDVVQVDPITYIGPAVTFEQIKIDLNIEGTVWTPSLYQNIHVTTSGKDGWSIVGSNLEHIFLCDSDGKPFTDDFDCWFQVRKGQTVLEYDDSSNPAQNTYHYENITASSNLDRDPDGSGIDGWFISEQIRNGVNAGVLKFYNDCHYSRFAGPLSEVAWMDVPVHDETGALMFSKFITLRKMYSGIRGGQTFTITLPATYISSSDALAWSIDPFTDGIASSNIARHIIEFLSPDGFLRPNDRITIADPPNNVAGTRIYDALFAENDYQSVGPDDFSSLVVEIFHGSVIVEGTLSADALVADFVIANNARVASSLVIGDQASTNVFGQLYSYQKTSFDDTSPGFFMDAQGHFAVGDQDSYVKFDPATGVTGGVLEIKGNMIVGGNYQLSLWEAGDDCELDSTNHRIKRTDNSATEWLSTAWVRSIHNYSTGARASAVPSTTSAKWVFGLNSVAGGVTANKDEVVYGFILNADDTPGALKLWINGNQSEVISTTYAPGDNLHVTFSGNVVTWGNGTTEIYELTGQNPEGSYIWTGAFGTYTTEYVTYSIGLDQVPLPKGVTGDPGAGFYTITENIPDAVPLTDFNQYITIFGIDSSGSGGIFGATGRDYAVKGDICVVKDFPHPDAAGEGSRVSSFVCQGGATGDNKWTIQDDELSLGYTFWIAPAAFIDGNLVVDGTISGKALRIYGENEAGDGILIGENDKQRIDIYSAGNLRVRLGDLVST